MILIHEDKSYLSSLDLAAIEKGIAEMTVYSLRITNYFTEEQKQKNSESFNTMTLDQWNERCEHSRQSVSTKVKSIVDLINQKFMIFNT